MLELADVLEALDDFSLENQEAVVMKWIEDKGYHLGNIMNAFRLTLVGEGKGPHMLIFQPFRERRNIATHSSGCGSAQVIAGSYDL